MAEDSPAIVTSIDSQIAVIRFNRAAARNPLSISTLHDLEITLAELTVRDDLKALIFTGTADIFASGANIRELAQLDSTAAVQFSRLGQRVLQTIAGARVMTIAAINGYCLGGALDLALACDIRVASASAIFSHPGARLGIITGWGGTQRLARTVGKGVALELLLTARQITSTEALKIGLISHLGDPPLQTALSIVKRRP